MRVCHIITRAIRGGADENTAHTCNAQVRVGHEVHLIIGRDEDPSHLEMLSPAVRVWRASMMVRDVSLFRDLAGLFQIALLLRRIRPEIVHTHVSKAGILGRIAAYLVGVPIIVHGVHILAFVNVGPVQAFIYRNLERVAALVTDLFISVGNGMRDECIRAGIGTPDRHVVVASGMDLSRFSRALRGSVRWRDVLNGLEIKSANPRFILLVSRLEERKGQFEFLSVFAQILRDIPDAVLLIAGEGPDHARLAARISELGLDGCAVLTGFRQDVERLMAIADVGLLTSRREGLARVLVQYALMGLPIVATHLPGSDQIVTDGVNGFLVPPEDLNAMQKPLLQLFREPAVYQKLARAQDQLDLSAWSMEGMNVQIEQLYRKLQQTSPELLRRAH